jgi:DNA helicase HerA-like ATPase
MGPILLSRLMDLTPAQDALLHIAFRIADENGWLMIDLDDLDAMLTYMEENKDELKKEYGRISSASIGAIRRAVMVLRDAGGDLFFGEPALDLKDLMRKDFGGR